MTERSGIGAQLGLSEEVTWGTYLAAARFLEFNNEALALAIGRNESKGLRTGQRVMRLDHWKPGKRDAGGPLDMDVPSKGFGLILKHLLGNIATIADGAGKKHTATIADLFGKGLSIQVGRPDINGTVQPFSYTGCKFKSGEFLNAVDGYLNFKADIDAQDESTAQALVAATAPLATEYLHWSGCVVNVGGANLDVFDASVKVENVLRDDRWYLRGARLKKEPIEKAQRKITGKLLADLESLVAYTRFVAGTSAAIIMTWTGDLTYDVAKPNKLVITLPSCRFDGTTPKVANDDVIPQELPFVALDDGTNQPITIDYYTADLTP